MGLLRQVQGGTERPGLAGTRFQGCRQGEDADRLQLHEPSLARTLSDQQIWTLALFLKHMDNYFVESPRNRSRAFW
jgi:hypothetical protein